MPQLFVRHFLMGALLHYKKESEDALLKRS